MPQTPVPAALYRGGTSRGVFFHHKDLPVDQSQRDRIFMNAIDAWNPSQVDGLGAGTSHTSKCVIIAPSERPDADINYTFVQVGIGEQQADTQGTCGNLMAAAAAFAINEGLVTAPPTGEKVTVAVYDTNVDKTLHITVPVSNGQAQSTGSCHIPGLIRPGALIEVDILHPGGGKTGKTLPFGPIHEVQVPQGDFSVTIADIVNPFIFVDAAELGIYDSPLYQTLNASPELLATLNAIRDAATVVLGWARTPEEATTHMSAIPKVAVVAPAQTYIAHENERIDASQVDITTCMLSMGRVHRTFAGSGLYSLAGACMLPGTIPHKYCRKAGTAPSPLVRLGHPGGVADVRAQVNEQGDDITSVGMDRTARRIMQGVVYIPEVV